MAWIDGFIGTFFKKFRFYGGYMFALQREWEEAVADEQISGYTPLLLHGMNTACAAGDALWAPSTAYTWQTADQTPQVVSSSANDAAAGTGAITVRIWWLDSANAEAYEDVNLNGVGAVNMTANTVRRINRVEVVACGTTGWNEGNISVLNTAGAVVMAYVPAGKNVNDGIIQTVPAGKADYIRRATIHATTQNEYPYFFIRASPADLWISRLFFDESASGGKPWFFDAPLMIPAGSDYFIKSANTTAGATLEGEFYGWRADA